MFDYYAQQIDGYARYGVGDTVTQLDTGTPFTIVNMREGDSHARLGYLMVKSGDGRVTAMSPSQFGLFVDYDYTTTNN